MTLRKGVVLAAATAAAGCVGEVHEPPEIVYRGTDPSGAPSAEAQAASAPASVVETANDRGVVEYDGYRAVVAREGDDVAAMAARAGVSPSALAAYNGLSTGYEPAPGDQLVLPPSGQSEVAGAPEAEPPWSSDDAADAIARAERDEIPPPPAPIEPLTGEGEAADEATPDQIETAVEDPEAVLDATPTPPPERPEALAGPQPGRQALAESAEPLGTAGSFQRPVPADFPIIRAFSKAPGEGRNDGVDFGAPAGVEVNASRAGAVALVSDSLGGLGTIVLIRHDNDYLTVYGRLDNVTVAKGDEVARGEVIGQVADLAPPREPSLHFELRRGAESVDPTPYL